MAILINHKKPQNPECLTPHTPGGRYCRGKCDLVLFTICRGGGWALGGLATSKLKGDGRAVFD